MKLRLLENPISDFRLSYPWKELIDFSNQFNFEKMDEIDYTHVPYFIFLIYHFLLIENKKIMIPQIQKRKMKKKNLKI